jgi:hypothetical protein
MVLAAALVLLTLPGEAAADVNVSLPGGGPTVSVPQTPTGSLPAPPTLAPPSLSVSAGGTLEYVTDLETPHYEVGGWVVTAPAPALLSKLVGRPVAVTGKQSGSVSIYMKPVMSVTAMKATLEGQLIETADTYELDGWVLKGLGKVQILAGSTVRITGTVLWDSAAAPKPALQVEDLTPVSVPAPQPITRRLEGMLQAGADQVYSVAGWALQGANASGLKKLSGQTVSVTGNVVTGSERPTLKVTELQATVVGQLVQVDGLESPHFEVNGFVVAGDTATLNSFASLTVSVRGTLSPDLSIYMKPVLRVIELQSVSEPLPDLVVVANQTPDFPTALTVRDGRLMLPLRAVIETAGGSVQWDPVQRAVRVTIGDAASVVRIGSTDYGSVELSVAPFIQDGYTMVPLDLLAHLGLAPLYVGSILVIGQ